jgi:hypothetical protein
MSSVEQDISLLGRVFYTRNGGPDKPNHVAALGPPHRPRASARPKRQRHVAIPDRSPHLQCPEPGHPGPGPSHRPDTSLTGRPPPPIKRLWRGPLRSARFVLIAASDKRRTHNRLDCKKPVRTARAKRGDWAISQLRRSLFRMPPRPPAMAGSEREEEHVRSHQDWRQAVSGRRR